MTCPIAYRFEWKPADYTFCSRDDFARESRRDGARVCGLFEYPQPGCQPEPVVFYGWCWTQPKYAKGGVCPEGFVPLYLGPVIHEPAVDEAVLFAFPSLAEPATHAYCLGTGTMERCKTCKHEDTWNKLNQLPDALRLPLQKRMTRISDDACRLTKASYYMPISSGAV